MGCMPLSLYYMSGSRRWGGWGTRVGERPVSKPRHADVHHVHAHALWTRQARRTYTMHMHTDAHGHAARCNAVRNMHAVRARGRARCPRTCVDRSAGSDPGTARVEDTRLMRFVWTVEARSGADPREYTIEIGSPPLITRALFSDFAHSAARAARERQLNP